MMIKSIRKNIRSILSATIGIIAAVITMCYLLLNINTYYMLSFFIVPVLFRFTIILLETKKIYRPELIPSLVLTTELILTIQCILAISFNNINSFFVMLDKLLFQYIERRQGPNEIKAQGFDAALVDRVLRMVNINEYKRNQFCPIIRISPKAFGVGRRVPIVGKYLS